MVFDQTKAGMLGFLGRPVQCKPSIHGRGHMLLTILGQTMYGHDGLYATGLSHDL